jgi:multidrug efflux pump subunit AcrA (membrane-fusion protein)
MKVRLPNLIVGALALAGLGTMIAIVAAGDKSYPVAAAVAAPPAKPFEHVVSGAGLIEAASENIAVGTPLPGIAERVFVKVGQQVEAGEPLFALDQRQVEADIAARAAAVEVARTRIAELQALEREAQDQLAKVRDLPDVRAVSREEIVRREIAVQAAGARVKATQAALVQAQAELAAARTEKSRLTVRAPIAGEVLQRNLRAGEFASPGSPAPLLVLGDTRTLHVRVDIDENDAWRVQPGAKAVAYVRGSSDLSTPAQFVRFEPLVIAKRSLTGNSAERVDTRVLQVLFAFPRERLPVYVGQQMDVMIEAQPIRRRNG